MTSSVHSIEPWARFAAIGLVTAAFGMGCRRFKNEPVDPYVQVVAGSDNTCARTAKGLVYCWGDNAFNSTSSSATDIPRGKRRWPTMVGLVQDAIDLDMGSNYGCAIERSGRVACFRDTTVDDPRSLWAMIAKRVDVGPIDDPVAVSLNVAAVPKVCVLGKSGSVACARGQPFGELPPLEKVAIDGARSIAVSDSEACATLATGDLWCWDTSGATPHHEADAVKSVSMASIAKCWIDATDFVTCVSRFGKPPAIAMKRVATGVYHACGIDFDGHVDCWGENDFGQLGERDGVRVRGVDEAVDIACGAFHTCALVKSGEILCWGRNHRGQLGDGTSEDSRKPVKVPPVTL